MWTDRHRTRHEARLKNMVLQASLDEVARILERADPPSRLDATPARQVLAGIAWHLRTGGGWRALPAGFPPWRMIYGWFRRWIEKGLFAALMRALARCQRQRGGRRPDPRLAIIDTHSVKCIGVRGPRGYDGAKKVVGRKRVALVDAEGHLLALAVVPANVQDRDTLPALDAGKSGDDRLGQRHRVDPARHPALAGRACGRVARHRPPASRSGTASSRA